MTEECAANKIASVRPSTAPRHRCPHAGGTHDPVVPWASSAGCSSDEAAGTHPSARRSHNAWRTLRHAIQLTPRGLPILRVTPTVGRPPDPLTEVICGERCLQESGPETVRR